MKTKSKRTPLPVTNLSSFIASYCRREPGAVTPLKQFIIAFRARLHPDMHAAFTRGRICCELGELGHKVGMMGQNKVDFVAGLTTGKWIKKDGGLQFVNN